MCSYCGASHIQVRPCKECLSVAYCDEECQGKHWQKVFCPSIFTCVVELSGVHNASLSVSLSLSLSPSLPRSRARALCLCLCLSLTHTHTAEAKSKRQKLNANTRAFAYTQHKDKCSELKRSRAKVYEPTTGKMLPRSKIDVAAEKQTALKGTNP